MNIVPIPNWKVLAAGPGGSAGRSRQSTLLRATATLGRVVWRLACGKPRPASVLRNHTNLPVFFAMATGIALLCNFVLKENSVQASRFLGPQANLEELQRLVARNPEDPAMHSRLGELHLQERNFKRAMFHFREASRLSNLYGD